MNELEERMAGILNELEQPFTEQYEVGERVFPSYCRSKYDNCQFRNLHMRIDDDDYASCDCGGDGGYQHYSQYGDELCKWYVPAQSYPLYILDFAIFIGSNKVCIECDGFQWHYAHDWQRKYDAARDKYLRDNGWIVKRFAGITITSHRNRVKRDLKEFLDSLKPKDIIQETLI